MPIQTNTAPYYNDYDASKDFYDILFRPGWPVQARELTQIPSILEEQIGRFGDHIFQDGSMVTPGQITLDQNFAYVKLTPTYNSLAVNYDLLDPTSDVNNGNPVQISGVTSGVTANVVMVAADINTIYVKYTGAGTNTTDLVFANNEVINLEPSDVGVCQAISTAATGLTAAASIDPGTYYIFRRFLRVEGQTIRLADYLTTPSVRVGLKVIESIVTPEDDQSLTDNAAGSPNYAAPGAHRYKIVLQLVSKPSTDANDENFVELMRLEAGQIQKVINRTVYSEIEKTLARRTQDINGSFVTTPFVLTMREDLNDGAGNGGVFTADQGGDITQLDVCASPGKAYVQGHEIETVVTDFVKVSKARDTAFFLNSRTRAYLGNYVFIDRLFGIPSYDTLPLVNLYDVHITTDGVAPGGSPIGTATIRGLEFSEGTFDIIGNPGPIWKAYLTNINITTVNKTLVDLRSFSVSDGTLTCTANILHELDIINVVGSFTPPATITDGSIVETVRAWNTTSNFLLTLAPNGAQIGNNVPLTSSVTGSAAITARNILFDPQDNILIYPLPQGGVATVRDKIGDITTTYAYRKVFGTQTESSGTVTFQVSTNEVFASMNLEDYVAVIETGANSGKLIDVTNASPSFGSALTQLTFGVPSGTTVKLSATVVKEIAAEKTKTLQTTNKSVGSPGNVITLDFCDVYSPVGIWLGTDNTGTSISSRYIFDSGQRDNYYDFGTLTLKPGAAPPGGPIYITYQYFAHGSGDYFSVDSYSNFGSFSDWYTRIPSYTTTSGKKINLRDALDFRAKRDEGNPSTITFPSGVGRLVKPNDDVITDFSYYLGRIDKIYMDPTGNWQIIKGAPSLAPLAPADPKDGGLVMATIQYGPFTFGPKDTIIKTFPNKCYTMPKIADLENRIANLEYYTALNLLEKETSAFSIPDAITGLDRFKEGFIVDPFNDSGVADVTNSNIKYSIDSTNKILRPTYNSDSVDMVYNDSQSANVEWRAKKTTNDLLTLPYTEVNLVAQTKASEFLNINPYSVFNYSGSVILNPATDVWKDTSQTPNVLVTDSSAYDGVLANHGGSNALGTVWNEWQTDWTGITSVSRSENVTKGTPVTVPSTNTVVGPDGNWAATSSLTSYLTTTYSNNSTVTTATNQSRQGISTTLIGVPQTTVSNAVVNVALAPFMRSIPVAFTGKRLKPNTKHFAFFDDTEVTGDCTPTGGSLGGPIVTDANGTCSGSFLIPASKFQVGRRVFRLVDDEQNRPVFVQSFADAQYNASGIIETDQKTITTVIDPQIQKNTVFDTRTLSNTNTNSESRSVTTTSTQETGIVRGQTLTPAPTDPGPSGDFIQPAQNLVPGIVLPDGNVQLISAAQAANLTGVVWVDPLAQSFLVNTLSGGYMLTSIGVFFKTADPSVPVTLQIRTMENGTPTQTVVPFSEVSINGGSVLTSEDATAETKFVFSSPVYLQQGAEYAFVLMANSIQYNVWVATIGHNLLNTDNYISTVPYAGVLFKSQNASTWTPQQGSAITFNIYRAKFDTTVTGAAYFANETLPSITLPSLSVNTYNGSNAIRIQHQNHGMPSGSMVQINVTSGHYGEVWDGIAVTNVVPTISGDLRNAGWASGVADPGLGSRVYIISDSELDSYVINIVNGTNTAVNATSTGFTGSIMTVTQNRSIDVLCPLISQLNFQGTNTAWYKRCVTNNSTHGNQVPYQRDAGGAFPFTSFVPNQNIYMDAPRVVASGINETHLINIGSAWANKSLLYLVEMVSTLDNLSPMVYTQRCSAIVIQNRIDNRTASNVPAYVTSASAATFVSELVATGSTGPMRYMTRPAQLANNSNAIHLLVSVMRPAVATVEAYYRIKDANTNEVFGDQPYVLMTPNTDTDFSPSQSSTDFKDYYWTADSIPEYSTFQVKLVMRSTNSSLVPLCKDLRAIALSD